MSLLSKQDFFNGIMLGQHTGITFDNRRVEAGGKPAISETVGDKKDAFFFNFHEHFDFLKLIKDNFARLGIESEIISIEPAGFVLETQRHPALTEEYSRWYE